jgi:hypothetical protein
MNAEGERWFRVHAEAWVYFPRRGLLDGMVFHRGPDLGWCTHLSSLETGQTNLAFVDAVAIVEQAATNALDESSAASTV